jgi:regulator of replication initiation timing
MKMARKLFDGFGKEVTHELEAELTEANAKVQQVTMENEALKLENEKLKKPKKTKEP